MITHRGSWWLPSSPEDRVHGGLSWDGEDHPQLQVDGQLSALTLPMAFGGGPLEEHAVIMGHSFSGEDITCFQCLVAGRSISLGGGKAGEERYIVWGGAFVGGHFADANDAKFTTYEASITHLGSWFPWRGLTEQPELNSEGRLDRYVLSYGYPTESMETKLGRATVKVSPSMQVSGERRRRQLHERLAFTLTYRERVSPMDVQAGEAEALRKLLTLATQHPNSLEELKVTLKDDTSGARDGYWLSTRSPRADVRHGRTEDVQELYQHQLLFTAANMPADRRTDILARWLDLLTSCPLGLNVLISDIESPVGHVDSRLLLIARAIEAIHRRKYPVSEAALRKHGERMAELRGMVTKRRLWDWTRGRLRRAYEPSLEERIRTILSAVAPAIRRLIPDAGFAAAFAQRRNAYTHEDPESTADLDHVQTFAFVIQAQYLLMAWVLVEIGFTLEETQQFLESNTAYEHFASQLSV